MRTLAKFIKINFLDLWKLTYVFQQSEEYLLKKNVRILVGTMRFGVFNLVLLKYLSPNSKAILKIHNSKVIPKSISLAITGESRADLELLKVPFLENCHYLNCLAVFWEE